MNLANKRILNLNVLSWVVFLYSLLFSCAAFSAKLIGWAEMPMPTHVEGTTTNQFTQANFATKNKQIVQGVSSILLSNEEDRFYFLVDNGFGKKKRSADFLLRLYEAEINFSEKGNLDNSVTIKRYLNIKDSNKKLGFNIQADDEQYYNDSSNPAVPAEVKLERLLTGADIDPESLQIDKNGHIWVGDEYGPFLLEINAYGEVVNDVIPLPDIASPDSPYLKGASILPSSAGFEAMAINAERTMLSPLLDRSVKGDDDKSLRIYQFDIETRQYQEGYLLYQMEDAATKVTDMVAVSETEFLVLERNSGSKSHDESFKKVFLIDLKSVQHGEYVSKFELLDLMRLDDPDDLNEDGEKMFASTYSLESLVIIDENTLLVANDNNYGGSTYFIKVGLDEPLVLNVAKARSIESPQWVISNQSTPWINFDDHSFFGWMTVLAYFLTSIRTGYKAKAALHHGKDVIFWLLLTGMIIFLGLNKQLDLHTNLTEVLKEMAKSQGWYGERRKLQVLFIVVLGLSVPIIFLFLRVMLADLWKRYKSIFAGVILLMVFIVIRAASFHHVQLLLYQNIGVIRFYQLLELLAIAVIFMGTFVKVNAGRELSTDVYPNASSSIKNDYLEVDREGAEVMCPSCQFPATYRAVDGRMFKCKSCKHRYRVFVVNHNP